MNTIKNQKLGRRSIKFDNPPVIIGTASTVGTKEGDGPLSKYFDKILQDDKYGMDTWEQAESKLQKQTCLDALKHLSLKPQDIRYILAGDLLNQCIGAHYSARDIGVPFFGLYGACSTMTESLSLGAALISGGYADKVMCATSSHFCSAEKQFRYPLEYGGQRAPSSQWTVTGAGCAVLSAYGSGPVITHVTTGKIVDYGITDINNMGAAMAPAAVDTMRYHFQDTGFCPTDYDLILTGDLGVIGSDIFTELLLEEGYDIRELHNDCGKMIYDLQKQDVHAGGSGCGCCASVFCGYIYKKLKDGEFDRIFLMATGALMNPAIIQQGESIPAIAHGITIERGKR